MVTGLFLSRLIHLVVNPEESGHLGGSDLK